MRESDEIPVLMGVQAGLITQEFLDAERELFGSSYPMYYECDFYNSSSIWYKPEYFQYGDYGENICRIDIFRQNYYILLDLIS